MSEDGNRVPVDCDLGMIYPGVHGIAMSNSGVGLDDSEGAALAASVDAATSSFTSYRSTSLSARNLLRAKASALGPNLTGLTGEGLGDWLAEDEEAPLAWESPRDRLREEDFPPLVVRGPEGEIVGRG